MKRIVYVAHPVGGDVDGNKKKILKILRELHLKGEVAPIAPYLVALQYLSDGDPEERALGQEVNRLHFERRMVDQLWLFGTTISSGMEQEIDWASEFGIHIVPKTIETQRLLPEFHSYIAPESSGD